MKGFKELPKVVIGVKRMREPDNKPFYNAIKKVQWHRSTTQSFWNMFIMGRVPSRSQSTGDDLLNLSILNSRRDESYITW